MEPTCGSIDPLEDVGARRKLLQPPPPSESCDRSESS